MTAVSDLLAASMAAHRSAIPKPGKGRDMAALHRAADLRIDALALDPGMKDPAWGSSLHGDLMAFYSEQIGAGLSEKYQRKVGQVLEASYSRAKRAEAARLVKQVKGRTK